METQAFFGQWEGKWFSQRSHYDFPKNVADNHKSELTVEALGAEATEVMALGSNVNLTPNSALAILKMTWDTSVDWGKPKQTGSLLYFFFADSGASSTGTIWRSPLKAGEQPLLGNYSLGSDETLTLMFVNGSVKVEERIWFASQNLRLRMSLIMENEQFIHSAFYSEIRKLPTAKTE